MKTRFTLGLTLLLAAGCVQIPSATADRSAPRYQVKTDGSCMELKATAALSPDEFMRHFDEHWSAGRKASAASLARRFPDVGVAALRARDIRQTPTEAVQGVANYLDEMLQLNCVSDGWRSYLNRSAKGTLVLEEVALNELQKLVREEKWKQVRNAALHSFDENYKASSIRHLEHAVRIALARAEAERRLGNPAAAEAAWRQAAQFAARLGVHWQDPNLWETLIAQRPVQAAWPNEVMTALLPAAPKLLHAAVQLPDFSLECLVWHTIGTWRLQRGEASAALAAFGKANSNGRAPIWDEYLQLEQARAWLALEQTPTAVSQLTPLTDRADSPWRASALALLGSAKLHDGHAQQALVFLKEALQVMPDFPGRAEAEADLGIAYLSSGQEAEGLSRLRAARERLRAAGKIELALLNLENEIRYLEETHQAQLAANCRLELGQLQGARARTAE